MQSFEEILSSINSASHIAIYVENRADAVTLGCASALYTYLLQLHKKASFIVQDLEIERKYQNIAWNSAIRGTIPHKVDYVLNIEALREKNSGFIVFGLDSFLDFAKVKINKKMAQSLYYALYAESQNFTVMGISVQHFKLASKLIEAGAIPDQVNEDLSFSEPLSLLRLKKEVLNEFELLEAARVAYVKIDSLTLLNCGAKNEDMSKVLEELLQLAHVEVAFSLINEDESIKLVLVSKSKIDYSSSALSNMSLALAKDEVLEYIKGKLN